jgi:dynein heavy chain
MQGFEDASTVQGRFRLLDSFDSLITRPIVADALEKKHSSLIEQIRVDIVEVHTYTHTHTYTNTLTYTHTH